jgi:hypothetical protein
MAQLATPPASRQPSEAPDLDPATDLVRSLDTLLERYLELLDKHQKLQGELASRFSSVRSTRFSVGTIADHCGRGFSLLLKRTIRAPLAEGMVLITMTSG